MNKSLAKRLEETESLSDIFDIVKEVVRDIVGKERSGLMLGLADLGGKPGYFIGAFYTLGSNIIIMNKSPLRVVEATRPEMYKSYCFHILLHEYLHTIGILDEKNTRGASVLISEKVFGENHPVTQIAKNFNTIFPEVMYASLNWQPQQISQIEIVDQFDRGSTSYIG